MDANAIGLIIAGIVSAGSAVSSYLFQNKHKWELETYKSGNAELREQAETHRTIIEDLKQENHRLDTQLYAKDITIEDKDKIIEELKSLAQQLPAFTQLSEQQRIDQKEITAILGDVATTLAELVKEVKGKSNAISNRRSTRKS